MNLKIKACKKFIIVALIYYLVAAFTYGYAYKVEYNNQRNYNKLEYEALPERYIVHNSQTEAVMSALFWPIFWPFYLSKELQN